MRKIVFNVIVAASFVAALVGIYCLGSIAIGAVDQFVPVSSPAPLPFLVP